MDIQVRIRIFSSHLLCSKTLINSSNSSSKFLCSSRRNSQEDNDNTNNNGDKTDWDKAWKSYRKVGNSNNTNKKKKKKEPLFSSDKYVTWNPRRSEFPLSEEVDPIRRTERSTLKFWTSPEFTLGGAVVVVVFLIIYTLLAPIPIPK